MDTDQMWVLNLSKSTSWLASVFDNAVVCELIEGKRPAGIFATLNDATATAHADPSAADNAFIQRSNMLTANPHFENRGSKFMIKHYAGDVLYNISGMTDKNKDTLVKDLLDLIEGSKDQFLHKLFPEKVDHDSKKRPPTAGDKIKVSCSLHGIALTCIAICEWPSDKSNAVPASLHPDDQAKST